MFQIQYIITGPCVSITPRHRVQSHTYKNTVIFLGSACWWVLGLGRAASLCATESHHYFNIKFCNDVQCHLSSFPVKLSHSVFRSSYDHLCAVPLKSLKAFLFKTAHVHTEDIINSLYLWPRQLGDSYMAAGLLLSDYRTGVQ